jgi:uracil-DNA glycosylase family 4
MDSNVPRPSSSRPVPAKVEAWLRYYDDLGVRLFYRDRSRSGALAASEQIPEIEETATPKPPKPAIAPPLSGKPSAAPASRVPQPPSAARPDVVVQGPSLFESAERIVGDTLERISADLGECTRCKLHKRRNKIVFGVGNPRAELVFVGEGPGHDEDLQGVPFIGRAGQLLTQMIEAMGLKRSDVYIANVVKCRPPENRTPEKDEVSTCLPYLFRQLAAIDPKVIVSLGSVATQALLNTNKSISGFRGQWFDFRGSRLMATYHPAYLLRNPHAKPEVWGDLKKVMAVLGLKPPRPKS